MSGCGCTVQLFLTLLDLFLRLFHMSVCGGGVVKGSCIVSDRYEIHKQTSPESEGTMSHNLWWCQFMSTCLILVTDLYPTTLDVHFK